MIRALSIFIILISMGYPAFAGIQDSIRHFYLTILEREPDAEGFNYWTGQVQRGLPLEHVRYHVAHSQEARNKVNHFYGAILERQADGDGFNHWMNALANGSASMNDVRWAFVNSSEATSKIDALYVQMLGRHVEASVLPEWRHQIAAHGMNIVRVSIQNSPEYQNRQAALQAPPPQQQQQQPQREQLNCWGKPIRLYGPCG